MIDTRFMYKLLKSSQKQVRKICERELTYNGYSPVVTDDYIYAPGTVPVLLIAHYDTVFDRPPTFVSNRQGILYNATGRAGIGADDRAGIYAVLELIKRHHCSVLFTGGEETGGIGATAFTRDYAELNVNYMIQFDRRNANDAVFYDGDNAEFEKFITSAGFVKATGSFTDICILAPHFGVSAVNLSVGYRDEHTAKETLCLNELNDTICRTRASLLDNDTKYEWVEKKYSWSNYRGWYDDAYGYYGGEYDWSQDISYLVWYMPEDATGADDMLADRIEVSDIDSDPEATAIGLFLISHPTLCYNDILAVELDTAEGSSYNAADERSAA